MLKEEEITINTLLSKLDEITSVDLALQLSDLEDNDIAEICANKIEPFCGTARNRGNSCYIIYSNEGGHYLHNIKLLKETVTKLDGKMHFKRQIFPSLYG